MAKKRRSKKATRKKAKAKKTGTALQDVSLAELHAELNKRRKKLSTLVQRRAKLQNALRLVGDEINQIEKELPRSNRTRKRARNDGNLAEYLEHVLEGRELTIGAAMDAVLEAGYQTTAENFRVIVNQKLTSDKQFKRVRRGVYTLK